MESSSPTRLLFLLSFLLLTSRVCLADMEEQSLVKVSPLRDYPQVALIRWTVPSLTTTATFTFFSNVSSACQANIKMSVRKIKKLKYFDSENISVGCGAEPTQWSALTEVGSPGTCCLC